MSLNNIKSKLDAQRGFTIVELLIVIVVIGILAAITIVSYNGITARANTNTAKSNASTFANKAEVYQADSGTNVYPDDATDITGASASSSYFISSDALNITYGTTALTSASNPNAIRVLKCDSGADPAAQTNINNTNITGLLIYYFDYVNNAEATAITVGDTGTAVDDCPNA